ncbi:HlyD family efflux transporter periplasmic adaptor subunit [Phenylobacterium sp.]|jgi:multidrug resistance efflux pump|uniref:HlyD family efflux transporter periplasmic adaptor subunit n=1 Tax=Phenylobacterium sp. TaxID=1871053 RepID=UPI002F3E66E7
MSRAGALAAATLLALALGGCRAPEKARAATAAHPAVAMARGVVEAEPALVRIPAQTDGILRRILAEEGDRVAPGQPLAEQDARQARLVVAAAEAETAGRRADLLVAGTKAAAADREAARLARLAQADAGTRQDAEQAAAAARAAQGEVSQAQAALAAAESRRRLAALTADALTVRAPAAGRILRRFAGQGAWAAAASPLFVLEPDGRRVVRAELDEAFADQVRPGMAAQVTREYQQGRAYRARVLRVADAFTTAALSEDPTARADTRVFSVVLSVEGGETMKLGQRVLVRIGP